ncbi:MAG: TetR/AcrR family transcriptional regulator [Phycisphaerae bacterium]
MPRPNQTAQRRKQLVPVIARAFAELGYRKATTAELAHRCGVRENILYRLWPDKKAMFVAAIEHVYELSANTWRKLLNETTGNASAAERLLRYESEHYGESGLHRIIFVGLGETDDPEIRDALRKMYGRFHRFIRGQVAAHRNGAGSSGSPDGTISAWAIVGLGNVANIGRELGLLTGPARKRMLGEAGRLLLDGRGG